MAVESVVETDPSILEVTPPFGARLVVPEFLLFLSLNQLMLARLLGMMFLLMSC